MIHLFGQQFIRVWMVIGFLVIGLAAPIQVLADDEDVFGKDEQREGEAALIGIFYDLKQNQKKQPVLMDHATYFKVMDAFIQGGWDEKVLNKYYRATKPLYSTQMWIPTIASTKAPEAFRVEKTVGGGYWLAHYRAQVIPPKNGTYRFVGFSDCQIIVAVNGKLVLVSTYWKDKPRLDLPECPLVGTYRAGEGGMRAGTWMDLKTSEPVDLDILWGDNGGVCSVFLQVEEKGGTYAMENGQPILPIFQLAPYDTPVRDAKIQPKFATGFPTWKGVQ